MLSVPPADAAPFFTLTKALHNALHSSPHTPTLCVSEEQAAAFERVGAACARDLVARWLPPRAEVQDEVIMLHDPQPLAMALHLRAALPSATLLWRCHIGSGKESTPASREAWGFLSPFLAPFTASIFSNKAYFPPPGAAPASQPHFIIPPGINPCSSKNRALSFFECSGILTRAGLLAPPAAVAAAGVACTGPDMFAPGARIYLGEGQWQDSPPPLQPPAATTTPSPTTTGAPRLFVPFLTRPVVTQISRWDRLKGWSGLVKGFAALKADKALWEGEDAQNICTSALCLVGPDPGGVTDDVEGAAVLLETCAQWDALPQGIKGSVFLVLLPMEDLGANAVMVVRVVCVCVHELRHCGGVYSGARSPSPPHPRSTPLAALPPLPERHPVRLLLHRAEQPGGGLWAHRAGGHVQAHSSDWHRAGPGHLLSDYRRRDGPAYAR